MSSPRRAFFLMFFTLSFPLLAHAHLGGDQNSVETDRVRISGKSNGSKKSTSGAYAIHEIQSDAHTIREYVDANGVVFGVAWNGNIHPDLNKLLGNYAGEYQSAFKKNPGKRKRHHQIQSAHLTVERGGHMRNFKGRAFVQSMIPAGVKTDEIK